VNPSLGRLLDEAARDLSDCGDARLESQILLGHALGVSRGWLAAHGDESADPKAVDVFRELVRRRRGGEPVAYLVGRREFYGLDFRVTPDVLIPRADTETLIEAALDKLPANVQADVLDLGTGSGCVAITLAHERPAARFTAVDVSSAALNVARQNAQAVDVGVEFVHSHWFEALAGRCFDMIISNPPYVAAQDPHLQQGDLRFEPTPALASGNDGLADIRQIVTGSPDHLRSGGWLLFEHGYDQAHASRDLLVDTGFVDVYAWVDIAGLSRVAGGRLLTSKSSNR